MPLVHHRVDHRENRRNHVSAGNCERIHVELVRVLPCQDTQTHLGSKHPKRNPESPIVVQFRFIVI
jgi:hypothetical protein